MLFALATTVGATAWMFAAGSPPGGGGSGVSAGKPPPEGQPAAVAQPSPHHSDVSPTPGPTVTVTVTATPRTAAPAPAYAGRPCRQVGVRLHAGTNRNAYGDGDRPEFTVRVEPKRRCVLDPDRLDFVVTSGTDRIWSAQDCPAGSRPVWTVGPRHPYTATVTWKRMRSNPATCGGKAPKAASGWYTLEATLGDERSNQAVFRLR